MQEQHSTSFQDKIKAYASEMLGTSFKFREGQLEAVEQVVQNAVADVKHTMLEAPTGSGKSMIALIAAYVLWKMFGKTSYILVSDLSLYKQYEDDIDKIGLECFGHIKGKENYICAKNGCKASQSSCSLQGVSANGMWRASGTWSCRWSCKYMQDYIRAVHAPITLMTYQLYFIQRNYVEDEIFGGKNMNFPMRSLVICDECHKICDVCQAHFAPRVSVKRPHWMDVLDKTMHMTPYENDRAWIVKQMESCSSNDELMKHVHEYEMYVSEYVEANERLRTRLAKKTSLTKNERMSLAAGNMARQEHCKLADMLKFVNELGSSDYVVKTSGDGDITLNFVLDDVMLKKYFHAKSSCELLMSATIGDFSAYARLAGMEAAQCRAIALPPAFDYSKSPVIVSSKNWMTWSNKHAAIREIAKQAVEVCNENRDVRGIIQTGSYENARELMLAMPADVAKRCLQYNSAAEKKSMLEEFIRRNEMLGDNSILVGPTLIEGLNFPDSACRFQICVKVPYACLGSEYVRKKMEHAKGWYEYDVLNKLCQGIGRGVRHKDDWCKTYILDGCVMKLVHKLEKFSSLNGRFRQI